MDFLNSIMTAAKGLRAQSGRMRIIAENIANADSTAATPGGDPYRRKIPTFRAVLDRTTGAENVESPSSASATSPTTRPPTRPAMSSGRTSTR